MKELKGSVIFLNRSLPANEQIADVIAQIAEEKSAGGSDLFFMVGIEIPNFDESRVKSLGNNGVNLVVGSNFESDCKKKLATGEVSSVDLRKKDIEDIYASFAQKETQGKIVAAENGLFKLKLISGSFSKSYIFRPES